MDHNLDKYLKDYLLYLQVEKNLSTNTIKKYRSDLIFLKNRLLEQGCTDWNHVTHRHLRQFLHYLQEVRRNSAASRSSKISTLKGFFSFLFDEQLINENPSLRLKKPKTEKKLPVYLSIEECERFIEVLKDHSSHQIRDVTIILLFLCTGIRLSELISLQVNDIDLQAKTIRVYGKGRKERILPLVPALVNQLEDYLTFRNLELGKWSSKFTPLFYTIRNNERRSLPQKTINSIFKKYSKLASINQKHFSPHKLRHTFATLLYTQGVDLLEIKQLLGHAHLSTTEIYTHISTHQLKDAISKHPLSSFLEEDNE